MILSHKYKFIFIKTKKVGGSSVSWYFDPLLGPDDIRAIWPRKDKGKSGHFGFYNHMTVREFIDLKGEKLWNEYFTFTIVRHPIDRLISEYFWSNRSGKFSSFSQFIRSNHVRGTLNHPIITDANGKLASFDFIVRYERLPEDFDELLRQLKIIRYRDMPKVKTGFRKDYRHWKVFVSKVDLEFIKSRFQKELKIHKELGYDIP